MFALNNNMILDKQDDLKIISEVKDTIQRQKVYTLLDEYISADVAERFEIVNKMYLNKYEEEYENFKSTEILFDALMKAVGDLKPAVENVIEKM